MPGVPADPVPRKEDERPGSGSEDVAGKAGDLAPRVAGKQRHMVELDSLPLRPLSINPGS